MLGFAGNAVSDVFGGKAHQGAGDLHGLRRFGGNFFRGLHHFRFQRLFVHDLVDNTGLLRGFRRKTMTERQQRAKAF